MSFQRAPKQWCLSKVETVNSFENWRQNLMYTLSLDKNFAPFLVDKTTWSKKTKETPLRGLKNDEAPVAEAERKTAEQKCNILELMLGQIANFCPIISRNTIVKNSTSVEAIWQSIRLHFGFQTTGAHFIDFTNIHLEPDERPEDLFQRLMAFVEDNLLKRAGLKHHGEDIPEDEEMSPTLENLVVLTWLRLIHHELPKLVKQRYGTELRSRTLASIKPEISQALDSLLAEINATENANVLRASAAPFTKKYQQQPTYRRPQRGPIPSRDTKICPLCKQAGRPDYRHFLSTCSYLPDSDRKFITKARQIVNILDDSPYTDEPTSDPDNPDVEDYSSSTLRVHVRQSPYLDTFYTHHSVRITIDSGATGNMIRHATATKLGVEIRKSSQSAHQADGSSPLTVVGETKFTLVRDKHEFLFDGLVVENLDVDILTGTPFMEHNDVAIRPAKREIILGDGTTYHYGSTNNVNANHSVRCVVLRAPPATTTVWPGDFIELKLPEDSPPDSEYAVEPHFVAPNEKSVWPPPQITHSVAGKIRIPNLTKEPRRVQRNEHVCSIRPVRVVTDKLPAYPALAPTRPKIPNPATKSPLKHNTNIRLNPDNLLSPEETADFRALLNEYDEVFDPNFKGYNGISGPFQAKVNMGPVLPPQRKGRLPQYDRNKLEELQQKFDELESKGVFKRPEEVDVSIEYLNPSFLVKKANGGHRLVTAFSEVGRYSKPQPSLMPDIDSTLRQIAKWKYVITTDLTNAFYQIPLSHDSMKYCGVATPFKGVRVYVRSAMGMPGSETSLEELMCRVLGELLQEGVVTKIADDIYCGGDTPKELLHNFRRMLHALHINGLCLSAPKTVIAPLRTTILGWIWSAGTLSANPHRIATLASCPLPEKVSSLRSFIGAYKILARVIPRCSALLGPLDELAAGRPSNEKISWTDELAESFSRAQKALSSNRAITLPKPNDQLWIVTDGASRDPGIGATLYVTRNEKLQVAGFFSAKLRGRQITWIPCEIEALAIAVAIKHFSPYIVQSRYPTCILTDSKPCVQAYDKLCRGEFSASPRVSTFLSSVSRYQATVRHVSGASILPSDFASRNPNECTDPTCQVCSFIKATEESAVHNVTIHDILHGNAKVPYTSRNAWLAIQTECPDLRRTHAHLQQGTRPSKKQTNCKDVKRYLNVASISTDGLLVVKRNEPLTPTRESIIVPRQVIDGLLTSLHIQLNHPTSHQMKLVTRRFFFALDLDKVIDQVCDSCHLCGSLQNTPHTRIEQTSSEPPETIGISFAADVVKRNRQMIFVIRECVTSYTMTSLIENERMETLRDSIIRLCIELCPLDGPDAVVRVDPAPGLQALVNDPLLKKHRITVEIGRIKNKNKNPVAEKANQELEVELLKQDPLGRYVSPRDLALATAQLNCRIRARGLSAREMLTQRDQFSNSQIPVVDRDLIMQQNTTRHANHQHSEKSKAPLANIQSESDTSICVGDLVYLHTDRNKSCARNRYLVVSIDGTWCNIQKFIGSQLRKTSYRVKTSECYKVPSQIKYHAMVPQNREDDHSDSELDSVEPPAPPEPPKIPDEIAKPPDVQKEISLTTNEQPFGLSNLQNIESPEDIMSSAQAPRRSTRQRRQPERYGQF